MNTFLIYLKQRKKIFEETSKRYLDFNFSFGKDLVKAIKYSFFSGGKRIRPILLFLFFESFTNLKYSFFDKKFLDYIFPPAFALECIHTYSLIHDDLPSMDNDDYRRGKPTCHKVFGEAIAILAGDALLNYAYEVLTHWKSDFIDIKIFYELKNQVSKIISKSTGVEGLVVGQAADLELEKFCSENLEEQIKFIIENKTVKLIKASVLSGYILSLDKKDNYKYIEKLAKNIGFIFQLVDDILDYEKEKKEGKKTFATLFGIEKVKDLLNFYKKDALEICEKLEKNGYKLKIIKDLIYFLSERKN